MSTILHRLQRAWRRWRGAHGQAEEAKAMAAAFQAKYASFKELLASNAELLNIMADMDEKLQGHVIFGMAYVRSQSAQAVFHALRMVNSLNALTRNRYTKLLDVLEKINAQIKAILETRRERGPERPILNYQEIDKDMVDWVGGKNANLGEVCGKVGLPVPEGFAITTKVQERVFQENDLPDEIKRIKMEMDPRELESVTRASEAIQAGILSAHVPHDLEAALLGAYDRLFGTKDNGAGRPVALRSSAIGEDSELTFAGQYLSFLNVPRERLVLTYKYILASVYTPRAIIYRLNKGLRDEDSAMAVACLELVDSLASGVMYSRHPFNILDENIIINAVWGLGPYAVDGTVNPDMYVVAKSPQTAVLESRIAHKPVQLVPRPDGHGTMQAEVAPESRDAPCLTQQQILALAEYALRLEEHYKVPQDVEWALDHQGRLFILQTRPLHLESSAGSQIQEQSPPVEGYELLLEQGFVACPGVGFGPAYHVQSEEDLQHFPEGAVLVARRSNPQFVMAMPRAQAIVTDAGSVTGHMASLTREFDVPAILGARTATEVIAQGAEITVDAFSGRVYAGKVEPLVALRKPKVSHMQDTPVYQVLNQVSELVTPLNLSDPKAPTFAPEHCRTLHDITRFVHEVSYQAMFQLSDFVSDHGSCSLKLEAPLPLDLYIIDLGEGLREEKGCSWRVTLEEITSMPFKALLKGMLHDGLRWHQPRPIEFKGLMSVMSQQLMGPGPGGERFGDRSYAIISDKYLNFSSRVGYHYAVLDSYCGQTINKNYITFSFKGGAADDVRRARRVRAIAKILEELEFTVTVKGDRVDARFQKDTQSVVEQKLDQIGRLVIFTRQMDMLMATDAHVGLISQCFLDEDYELCALEGTNKKEK
ncbi:MAG TPA: phosphoenolpyruvate synthase [Desulfonatronum sp.]|nr:phosphoenolpyruvate synthase [Desulfonatronum sp.]